MRTKILFLLLALQLNIVASWAVPACPYPVQYKQPDGSLITILLKGDERVNWATSPDGYSLLLNKEGFYEYASKNAVGDLNLSGVRVHDEVQRTQTEINLLKKLQKDLRYSREQINLLQQFWKITETNKPPMLRSSGVPQRSATGFVKAPLILVDFPNKPFTKTKTDFELIMNQPDYTAGGTISGSVYDYFQASSYGQLDYHVDIFGPYTLSHEIAYYDDNTQGGDPRAMAYEAAVMAHNDGCDFSNYDYDNDGVVDGIHIIFAGYDQAAGAPAGEAIWSHAWAIWGEYALTLDNKQVYRYSCSTELRGTSGANITYIGVIAHELSHVFGLPDLYDTDYNNDNNGQAIHLDQWDIMASGSWNDGGRTPAYHSAWCRDYLGWVPAVELTEPGNITLPNPADQGAVYRINTSTPNEYFLLENRQQQSWDSYIPSSGMLIYHVDENHPEWNSNCINCNPSYRGLYVKQAGGGANSNSTNRAADPYPSGGNTHFTDYSVPNSKSWAGQNTGKPIMNIVHDTDNGTVSFLFMEILSPVTGLMATVEGDSVSLEWIAPDEEMLAGYTVYRNNQLIYTISNKTVTTFTQNNMPNGNYNYCVAALYNTAESPWECIAASVTEGNDNTCPPVRNLQVMEETAVNLSWDAPFTEGWISYAGDPYWMYSDEGAVDLDFAAYWSPEDLQNTAVSENMLLKKVRFFPTDLDCEYSVRVWKKNGDDEPELIVNQLITQEINHWNWNEISLTTPLSIDPALGLIIGIRINSTQGWAIMTDDMPAVSGKGNLVHEEGAGWYAPLDHNWCIAGYLEYAGSASPVILQPSLGRQEIPSFILGRSPDVTKKSVLSLSSGLSVKKNHSTVSKLLNASQENGISYKIYRDGELIGTSQTTNYTDANTTIGNTYSYCVSVQYNDGCESEQVCAEAAISDYAIKFYEAAVDPASEPLNFVQSSPYPWAAGENYVLNSNQGQHSTSSWFATTLTHTYDISLSFDWTVDSEANYDFLRFYINDQLQEQISGGNGLNFTTKTYELTSGTYTLKWEYYKDGSVSSYSDAGYVRNIKAIYNTPLELPTLWTDKEEVNFFLVNTPNVATGSILIRNKGFGDLIIEGIENIAPPFSVQYSNDPILYTDPATVQFSFAPEEDTQGLITQSIEIVSNGGNKTILLKSYANVDAIHIETPGTLKDLIPENIKQQITDLKLTGYIDARDFRYLQGFSSLSDLDISEVSIAAYEGEEGTANWYAYYPENEVPMYAFRDIRTWQTSGISSIQLPYSATSIGVEAFSACYHLNSVQFPEGLTYIREWAFSECNSLLEIDLPASITTIEGYAFAYCTNLQEITVHWLSPLPVSSSVFENVNKRNCTLHVPDGSLEAYLNANVWKGFLDNSDFDIDENGVLVGYYGAGGDIVIPEGVTAIHNRVFLSNGTITSAVIPSTVTNIGGLAFAYCYNLQSIHYSTYSPATLRENEYTFDGIDRSACNLYVPDKAIDIFLAANIWKDFNITGSNETINDIYIHNRITFTNNVRPEGQPHITITPTGSLLIQGTAPLETNHFQMHYKGKGGWYEEYDEWGHGYSYYLSQQAANLINELVDIQAENVSLRLELWGNTWYYLSFPFDVKIADIQIDPGASFVFRKYDGDMRATVGFGNSWQNVSDTLHAGVGYAFRCNQDVYNLILPAAGESGQNLFASASQVIPLQEYASGYASDKSWNLTGNPYPSYFDFRGIEFTAPITVWRNDNYYYGYVAYSPVDDEYVLSPFEAFFVQKPNDLDVITFSPEGRLPDARSRMETPSLLLSNTNRKRIDMYLSNGKFEDKSRVVINPEASQEYELHCDAAKFMSPDNRTPQLYSIDASNTSLAINERPLADGIVLLGYYAGESGSYTIRGNSAWNEGEVFLIDHDLNRSVDLNETDYAFDSEQGSFNNRFELRISHSLTGVTEESLSESSVYGQQGMVVIKTGIGNAATIYMLDGRKIKEFRTMSVETAVALSKGIYIVQINNETFKIIIY
jgi:M6 family metalloprotease-like protein